MIEVDGRNVFELLSHYQVRFLVFTGGIESLRRESDRLDVVVEHEGSVDLDQADVVDDDAGIVVLQKNSFIWLSNKPMPIQSYNIFF